MLPSVDEIKLKIVDKDGKFTYSNIVKTEINRKNIITINPNPAKDYISINGIGSFNFFELVDVNSKIVKRIPKQNNNQYNIADLKSAVYIVRIISNKTIITSKIVIK
jgi:Secretion system C-terminal sorting domain